MQTIRAGSPLRREPMFNAPVVVLGLIAVLLAIHAVFNWAPYAIQDRVIRDYAFIPGRLTIAIWPDRLIDLIHRASTDPSALQQAREIRGLHVLGGGPKPWTLLTYAFLHGSWTHVRSTASGWSRSGRRSRAGSAPRGS